MSSKKKTIGLAVGSAFVAGMAVAPLVNAADNPFALQSLQGGYMVADHHMGAKAPEAKCGGMKADAAKASEAKCGGMKADAAKASEAKCGGMKQGAAPAAAPKAAEAKCGQGKCGAMKK